MYMNRLTKLNKEVIWQSAEMDYEATGETSGNSEFDSFVR